MRGKTHIAIGVCAAVGVARATDTSISAIEFFMLIIGSLAPDIDSRRSTISHPGSLLRAFLPRWLVRVLNGFGQVLSGLLEKTLGHRGATHSLFFGFLLLGLGVWLDMFWLCWFAFGYLLHIGADSFTKGGVKMFGKRRSHSSMKTGSFAEEFLFWGFVLLSIYLGYGVLPEDIRYWLEQYKGQLHL